MRRDDGVGEGYEVEVGRDEMLVVYRDRGFCLPCIYFYKDPLRRVGEWIRGVVLVDESGRGSRISISTVICGCMFPLCNNSSTTR